MQTSITISPVAVFNRAFPDQRQVYAYSYKLKYRYASEALGKFYEGMANRLIMDKGLPLVTELKIGYVGGKLREVALFIKPVPEEEMVMDEAPGEVMEPDWWNGSAERE
jgi:hypothetical protein